MGWIAIGFSLVLFIDLTPLIMQRNLRAIIAFSIIFILALTLAILQVMDMEIPPILYIFENILKSIGLSYPAN